MRDGPSVTLVRCWHDLKNTFTGIRNSVSDVGISRTNRRVCSTTYMLLLRFDLETRKLYLRLCSGRVCWLAGDKQIEATAKWNENRDPLFKAELSGMPLTGHQTVLVVSACAHVVGWGCLRIFFRTYLRRLGNVYLTEVYLNTALRPPMLQGNLDTFNCRGDTAACHWGLSGCATEKLAVLQRADSVGFYTVRAERITRKAERDGRCHKRDPVAFLLGPKRFRRPIMPTYSYFCFKKALKPDI